MLKSSNKNLFFRTRVKNQIINIIIALFIAFILRFIIFPPIHVTSLSMYPILKSGENGNDHVLLYRYPYLLKKPVRGDIIAYISKLGTNSFGRIIGLKGEKIHIEDGILYVNNEKTHFTYLNDKAFNFGAKKKPLIPKDSSIFIISSIGKVKNSKSKVIEIQKKDILGKVFLIYWPLRRIGRVQ